MKNNVFKSRRIHPDGSMSVYTRTDRIEYWEEFDKAGRRTSYRNSLGYEYTNEYNERGELIHFIDNKGNEEKYTQDYIYIRTDNTENYYEL